jgi:ketopantoate reductase
VKKLWLIWARTLDHRVGKNNEDQPDIPILTLKQAQISLAIRTIIVLTNMATCIMIILNIIKNW